MSHEQGWRFNDSFLRELAAPERPALHTAVAVRRIGRRRFLQLSGIAGAVLVLGAAAVPRARAGAAAAAFAPNAWLAIGERDILICLAQGESNKEIARTLDLAESTVKIHVQNIFKKLNMSSRVQVALYAAEQGYGRPPQRS